MPVTVSSFPAIKTSSITTKSSSTSIRLKLHAPPDDVARDSWDEPCRMCRESVFLCKTDITLIWPLSWQRIVYTFIKAHNTATALYILNIITVKLLQWITTKVTDKSPSPEASSCSATHSIPCLLQNMWVHYYFHHSLTHTLSPNSFSPSTFCSHTHSSLNNIATIRPICLVHFKRHVDMPKCRTKKSETLTNNRTPDLTYQF